MATVFQVFLASFDPAAQPYGAEAESGSIVIAAVNEMDATCKRLKKYSHGIALLSANPAYDPMYFSNEETITEPVKILGKVIELRAKFD